VWSIVVRFHVAGRGKEAASFQSHFYFLELDWYYRERAHKAIARIEMRGLGSCAH